ncbi:hypothetical protein WK39_12930 [Burkholderia cepacia]|uniref:Uncharacterized protein n=1 Tax=Burkholderia reimsis TaxID=2234132 RepID=A0A365QN14_9BURK|nr:hypothetical protein WK39_12930 [Burkholderia cepacia]RBB35504.1 hypothetical protein DPV79_27875 [Burkholderia reimsis]KVS68777.1 hypothetical protein WK40_07450 [Burkholderia cepacia]KWB20004.1 hypothetical protein WL32_18835 [Burkholderia cepacia]RQT72826.1 hypothetical protein DF045_15995 [Burkholderia cepacia]
MTEINSNRPGGHPGGRSTGRARMRGRADPVGAASPANAVRQHRRGFARRVAARGPRAPRTPPG